MIGPTADLLSLVYAVVALYTLWQLPRRWRALTDPDYTAEDRNLANRIGFLLLTPLGVLAHEAAHYVAADVLGAQRLSMSFRVYWGYVAYAPRLGVSGDWMVAAVGPAASLALGLIALVAATRLRHAGRDIMLGFAHATLLLVLILYPLMSAVEGVGDFVAIYGRAPTGLAVAAGVVHALGLGAYLLLVRRLGRQDRRQAWAERDAEFAGRAVALSSEALLRIRALEEAARFRRLTPEERQQLDMLVDLRDWSAQHNRTVGAARSGHVMTGNGSPLADTDPTSGLREPHSDARSDSGRLDELPTVRGPVDLSGRER